MSQNEPIPNQVSMTIAQITNATAMPSVSPAITNNGLPFGSNEALSPPVGISGDVLGFGDFSGLVLAYFGSDETGAVWSTGTGWVAAVTTTGTYTAALPVAAEQFATVVVTETFWNDFLAANPAVGGTVTVDALPSAASSPGQVLLSGQVLPGDGRSIAFLTGGLPTYYGGATTTLPPGTVYPTGMNPVRLTVTELDRNGNYTVNGQPVTPTDPAFIGALVAAMPYAPPYTSASGVPSQGSIQSLTVRGVSTDPNVPGGYMCIILYQAADGSLYLLLAEAGPAGFYSYGALLWGGWDYGNKSQVSIDLTSVVNAFSDQVTFNVTSASAQVSTYSLSTFADAVKITAKICSHLLFSLE